MDSKYGDWRNLEEATRGSRVSTWWKDINIIDPLGADGSVFDKGIKWKVGCGEKAKFWEDGWKEDGVPFKLKYPTLFSISKQQQHLIKMMGNFTATGWEWDFKWRRQLFDDEMEMAVKFLQDLEDISIHPDREDKWIWKEDASGVYSAGSEYKKLMSAQTDENQDGVFTELWKVKAPSKAVFFAWRLLRDRLPTKMNLRRRNVEINDPTCPFCKYKDEDATHLFFSCNKIMSLWWESVSWTNTLGPFPQIPRMHFLQHVVWNQNGSSSQIWKCWWISLTWSIWQHRNNIVFEGDSFNGSKILEDAVFLCWTWQKNLNKDFDVSFHHWSNNMKEAFM